jgi:hypothetical protein
MGCRAKTLFYWSSLLLSGYMMLLNIIVGFHLYFLLFDLYFLLLLMPRDLSILYDYVIYPNITTRNLGIWWFKIWLFNSQWNGYHLARHASSGAMPTLATAPFQLAGLTGIALRNGGLVARISGPPHHSTKQPHLKYPPIKPISKALPIHIGGENCAMWNSKSRGTEVSMSII